VHRPAARRVRHGESLHNVFAQFHQIPRDHAISPFVLAPDFARVPDSRSGKLPRGLLFSTPSLLRCQR
jgi:hypothetical protein